MLMNRLLLHTRPTVFSSLSIDAATVLKNAAKDATTNQSSLPPFRTFEAEAHESPQNYRTKIGSLPINERAWPYSQSV